MARPLKLLLVGCGKMGGGLLKGWRRTGAYTECVVVDPAATLPEAGDAADGLTMIADAAAIPSDFVPDALCLAVKPQMMEETLPAYARFVGPETVFLSIAAGKTIDWFRTRLGDAAVLVRAMPNTPAAVGHGMTVACSGPGVTPTQRTLCDDLLRAVGAVGWVEDESLMHAVTALSGGGPAYVFLLIEVLAKAGQAAGLSPDLAERLARTTVIGSAELAARSPESAATLRENVSSPGGTTLEALNILMAAEDGLQPLFDRAIAAACARSRALAC